MVFYGAQFFECSSLKLRNLFAIDRNNCKLCNSFNMSAKWARVELGRMDCVACFLLVEMGDFSDCGFFHVCTDGNQLPWFFKDTEDFVLGVNRAAICTHQTGIQLYSYVLMDNHVHFVCYGEKPECKDFINRYKNLSGKHISSKYGIKGYIKGLKGQVIPLPTQESLMEGIGYIDRNSIVAGYGSLPMEYPWGSSRYLFREESGTCRICGNCGTGHSKYRTLRELTVRERWRCTGTRLELPGHWEIDERGMILPCHFLEIQKVESLFKTPNRYLYFLSKKLEGKVDELLSGNSGTFIPDKFLRPIVSNIARELYGKNDVNELNFNARIAIARRLRYEYAATVKQISRMLYLNAETLKGFF